MGRSGSRNLCTSVAIYQQQWTTYASTFLPSDSAYHIATDFHLLHKQYTDLKLIQLGSELREQSRTSLIIPDKLLMKPPIVWNVKLRRAPVTHAKAWTMHELVSTFCLTF